MTRPAEDGLEEQLRACIRYTAARLRDEHEDLEEDIYAAVLNFIRVRERDALVKFIGSQARAAEERERELREKLEGLRDDCDEKETSLRNLGEPEIADEVQRHTEQLNALLASHWPAQKEGK